MVERIVLTIQFLLYLWHNFPDNYSVVTIKINEIISDSEYTDQAQLTYHIQTYEADAAKLKMNGVYYFSEGDF